MTTTPSSTLRTDTEIRRLERELELAAKQTRYLAVTLEETTKRADKAEADLAEMTARAEESERAASRMLIVIRGVIPESEHPLEPTLDNWLWQIRNLAEDRKAIYKAKEEAETERNRVVNSHRGLLQAEEARTQVAEARALAAERDASLYKWLKGHAMLISCADDDSEAGNFALGEEDDDMDKLDDTIRAAIDAAGRK